MSDQHAATDSPFRGGRVISLVSGIAYLLTLLILPSQILAESLAERAESGRFASAFSEVPHDQGTATLNAFFGRPDLNVALENIPRPSDACPDSAASNAAGREWLIANVENHKVLMFNENHYGLRERVFVRKMLPALRDQGFTHIGFEALRHDAVNIDGRYLPATEIYTREPLFAALLRESESLGFSVFGYEPDPPMGVEALTPQQRFELRETGQAEHIAGVIQAAGEDARFVIFAGWSHIAKEPVPAPGGSALWMAGRLMEKTGITPLSIDLTSCVDTAPEEPDWAGRLLLDEIERPMGFGRDAHAFDAEFRLPALGAYQNGSPGFYRQSLGSPVAIPEVFLESDEPVLIEARNLQAAADAAAFDRLLLSPGDRYPLYLPPGEYQLIARSAEGEILATKLIAVDD